MKHVSETSREAARQHIRIKLDIIMGWLNRDLPWLTDKDGNPIRDKNGEMQLDFIPINELQFSKWKVGDCCDHTMQLHPQLSEIKKISRSTIDQPYHADLKIEVNKTCDLVRLKIQQQLSSSSKTSQISELETELNYWRKLASKQETEIVLSRIKTHNLEVDLRKAHKAIQGNIDEHERIVSELNKKISELTGLLSKVTSIRGKRNDGQN